VDVRERVSVCVCVFSHYSHSHSLYLQPRDSLVCAATLLEFSSASGPASNTANTNSAAGFLPVTGAAIHASSAAPKAAVSSASVARQACAGALAQMTIAEESDRSAVALLQTDTQSQQVMRACVRACVCVCVGVSLVFYLF
jgi:hypothetical protein